MKRCELSRRGFLQAAIAGTSGALLVDGGVGQAVTGVFGAGLIEGPSAAGQAGELERVTESNIEGPFYRPGAPFRTRLYEKGDKGDVVRVSGLVVARSDRPIKGAVLEVWNASAVGRYDNEDPQHPPGNEAFRYRGRIKTDDEGRYEFETVRPGHYKIGPTQFRAAHIHLKVYGATYKPLVTQLFFAGDRYNPTDPWFKPSLVVELEREANRFAGHFKIVLAKA